MAAQCKKRRVRSKRFDSCAVPMTVNISMHEMHVIEVQMGPMSRTGPQSCKASCIPAFSLCTCVPQALLSW
jgi:hypothetical protein